MKMRYKLLYIFFVLTWQVETQADLPTFSPDIAQNIQKLPEVKIVNDQILRLEKLRIAGISKLGFQEGTMCITPVAVSEAMIDPHRSLMVHDDATLTAGNFSLRRTLQKLSTDVAASVPGTSPVSIFRQFWDTQSAAPGVNAANIHCSDNNGKIGAYPFNRCPRSEGNEALGDDATINTRLDEYRPLALVNRLDLADAGWKNCGEHRIVYGKDAGGIRKNLIIFESVLPNPQPGCRSGCRDVIEFWTDLSSDPSPASRAVKLETFFYSGLPGFRPVVHTSHYSSGVSSVYGGSGSGQIRTNQFVNGDIWTLKEFKTLLSCAGGVCDYDLMPISVKVNPYGVLWNRDVAGGATPTAPPSNAFATPIAGLDALATEFQNEVLAQVTPSRLGNPDINTFSYEVKPDKNAAESQSQTPAPIDHYRDQTNNAANATFRNNLTAAGAGLMPPLNANQIVNRALAHSCAGCHMPSLYGLTTANSIGVGMNWPPALNFVHVDVVNRNFSLADGYDPAQFGGNASGSNISPALLTTFLPARRTVLTTNANEDVCDCVRKPIGLTANKLLQFKDTLARNNSKIQEDLSVVSKATERKPEMRFSQSRAVLTRIESARNAAFKELGVTFAVPSLKAEPFVLSEQKLEKSALFRAKREAIEKIVKAEPPRKSITGSFRSH